MKILMSAGIIFAALASVAGQGTRDVDRLDEKIRSHLEFALPGWNHKRVPPIKGSKNVMVHFWYSAANVNVKVDVSVRPTADDAKREIRSFLEFRKKPLELKEFGEEAFTPEFDGSDLVLRKGRYVIYLSMVDLDAGQPRNDELKKTGREFAKQLSLIDLE